MSNFTPYIIAVPHQRPAKIYADDLYGTGFVAAVTDEDLEDFHQVHHINAVEDEEWLLSQDGGLHQASTIYKLIMDRRSSHTDEA